MRLWSPGTDKQLGLLSGLASSRERVMSVLFREGKIGEAEFTENAYPGSILPKSKFRGADASWSRSGHHTR